MRLLSIFTETVQKFKNRVTIVISNLLIWYLSHFSLFVFFSPKICWPKPRQSRRSRRPRTSKLYPTRIITQSKLSPLMWSRRRRNLLNSNRISNKINNFLCLVHVQNLIYSNIYKILCFIFSITVFCLFLNFPSLHSIVTDIKYVLIIHKEQKEKRKKWRNKHQ